MLLSLRKNGLTSLFKEVRAFKVFPSSHIGLLRIAERFRFAIPGDLGEGQADS